MKILFFNFVVCLVDFFSFLNKKPSEEPERYPALATTVMSKKNIIFLLFINLEKCRRIN